MQFTKLQTYLTYTNKKYKYKLKIQAFHLVYYQESDSLWRFERQSITQLNLYFIVQIHLFRSSRILKIKINAEQKTQVSFFIMSIKYISLVFFVIFKVFYAYAQHLLFFQPERKLKNIFLVTNSICIYIYFMTIVSTLNTIYIIY